MRNTASLPASVNVSSLSTWSKSLTSSPRTNLLSLQALVRIHRAIIVNVDFVHELHPWLAGRMLVRLNDEKQTELSVARDRVKELKERLGI